jgi:hypothetical protein
MKNETKVLDSIPGLVALGDAESVAVNGGGMGALVGALTGIAIGVACFSGVGLVGVLAFEVAGAVAGKSTE